MSDDILRRLEHQFRKHLPTIVLNKADAFEFAATRTRAVIATPGTV